MLENISSDEHPKFERQAHAPYNFVPLPARVLTVLSQEEIVNTSSLDALNEIVNARLPAHNTATTAEQFTGYFEVILETFAPLYVRGPMTTEQFKFNSAKQYANGEDIKENKVEFRRLAKNLPEFFFTQDKVKPVIPGSSLRGMLRSLVEVITYSKFVAVSKTPRMFYRAVADEGNDPRRQTYKDWIGNNASKVSAGFLTRNEVDEKGEWFIQPAKLPKQIGGRTSDAYIKIDDTTLVNMLQGYVSLNSKDYVPQFREVSFDAELQEVQSNKPNAGATNTKKLVITAICNDRSKHAHVAWLACSGNMLETADWSKNRMYPPSSSPRKKQYLILEFGKDEERPPKLRVSKSVIDDYITSLTPYQQHTLGELGICHNGHPVFFTKDAKDNVTAIGHSPNFRIPSKHWEENRAVTPADFVPDHLKRVGDVDMGEAIFGFTRSGSQWKELCDIAESLNNIRQGHPLLAYSGRVSVTDATLHLGTRAEH
jgi:CRISPR-associated protein (TIGR03986 family)